MGINDSTLEDNSSSCNQILGVNAPGCAALPVFNDPGSVVILMPRFAQADPSYALNTIEVGSRPYTHPIPGPSPNPIFDKPAGRPDNLVQVDVEIHKIEDAISEGEVDLAKPNFQISMVNPE